MTREERVLSPARLPNCVSVPVLRLRCCKQESTSHHWGNATNRRGSSYVAAMDMEEEYPMPSSAPVTIITDITAPLSKRRTAPSSSLSSLLSIGVLWCREPVEQTTLLDLVTLPQSVVQVVAQSDANSVVLFATTTHFKTPRSHLLRRHRQLSHSKRVLLSFGENGLHSSSTRTRTTGSPLARPSGNLPPGEVRPRHMIFAPERTNLIAPLSTCTLFIISGATP